MHTYILSACWKVWITGSELFQGTRKKHTHSLHYNKTTAMEIMAVIGGENNHVEIAEMIEPLMIPSMKSEVMSTAAKWLDEEQASEWPRQKQGWQPSGLTGCRLKNPGLHLFATLQYIKYKHYRRFKNVKKKEKKRERNEPSSYKACLGRSISTPL